MGDDAERKNEKIRMRTNDLKNSTLLELFTEGIAFLNVDGQFIYSTPSAQKLVGYNQNEFEGMRINELANPLDIQLLEKAFDNALANLQIIKISQFRLLRKDGTYQCYDGTFQNKLEDLSINGIVLNCSTVANQNFGREDCGTITSANLLDNELFTGCVLASLSDQVAVISEDGTVLAVNKAWEEFAFMLGEERPLNGSVGSNYIRVCEAAVASGDYDVQRTLDGILSVFSKKVPSFHQEYPCFTATTQKWFVLNVLPFGDDDTKVVITHQDITKRKLAEINLSITAEKLKTTLSKLSTILDSSLDLICTINSNMEFVTINKASFALFGYMPEELIGTKFINLVPDNDKNRTLEAAENISKGLPLPLFENSYVHKNGKIVPLMWSVNWDDRVGIMYAVAKDMTDKKKLEKSIELERDHYYNMFLKAPSAVVMLKGKNHTYELANPLYLQLVGKTNIIGKTVLEVIPEVKEQGYIKILDRVYRTGRSRKGKEVLIKLDRNGDGILVDTYLNFIFQAYRNFAGEIEGIFVSANDITEQILSRKVIEKRSKFFKGVIESSQDMVATISATGKILYASPSVSKKYGFDNNEILKRNISDSIHPDDLLLSRKLMTDVLHQPLIPIGCSAVRQYKKDGTYMWVEATLTNFLKTEGINAIVVNFRDISTRRKAESLLRETMKELEEERTRLITAQEVAKIGSWEISAKTYEVAWSNQTFHILGADPKNFKASYDSFLTFIHPEDRQRVSDIFIKSLSKKGTHSVEHRILTLQGAEKWAEEKWTISRDLDGIATFAVGTCQDITERKEAEQNVLKSETKLKIAQHIAHVGSWEIDVVHNEHSWSDEYFRILEIDRDVKPSEESFYTAVHPEDLDMVMSNIKDSSVNTEISNFLFRFVRKNGEIGFASTEWRSEYDIHGNKLYMYGILRDLTAEQKADQERQKMIVDIIQRNKDLEQFSYIISHNLRSPVANIIGLTEELKDDTHSAETVGELREAIGADVKRLEEVIVDLNSIVQTKRDIIERKEEVALSEIIENILLSINYLVENQGVTVITDFESIDHILTIKSYIQSIFYNLISNSIKYRRNNVELIINVRTQIVDKKVQIFFTDNGIGIDLTRYSPHMFGLYKRFHPGIEGKGLGLYMVKTQVETLGGIISVKSDLDLGTEFCIEFENF